MSDHFTIPGAYTGGKYLVTAARVDGEYLLTVYEPRYWSRSASRGLSWHPGCGHQFRGRWLRRQHRRARRYVRALESAARRKDRRQARIARLVKEATR